MLSVLILMTHMRILYKSDKNKVLSGVLGGLGEYYNVDPTILRLGFLIIVLMSGLFPGVIAYIIAVFIVPSKPVVHHMHHTEKHEHKEHNHEQKKESEEKKEEPKQE